MKPDDDYTHELTDEPNFNESMYFQLHDLAAGVGGFFRIANRPNEGRGERTVCIYLPDGRVAFGFDRPAVTTNKRLDAGGLTVTVVEPFQRIDIEFVGRVNILADPQRLEDPKSALSESPVVDCTAEIQFSALAPVFAESFDSDGESFAPNHYEQPVAASGRISIGDELIELDGHGLRDHSWGPRSWQAPWFYRWIHGTSADLSFMGAYFGKPDGSSLQGGFVLDGDKFTRCDRVSIVTERDGNAQQTAATVSLSAGARTWTFVGSVESNVPLRHRKKIDSEWAVSRIVEGSTRWRADDGRELHGMTEYLDQMRGQEPVGLAV
ncbi:DUF7064 domain-containing protein [Gordonia polyisoprenivorans]|uniref:DUF7064 domain-containing protein n=1 Tax=Gordonia polyisoprenivorans TaxID=84595 RepID=UPI001AD7BB88|nr:hypothetical protein [Gordonia polyisoprenivorans]QTI69055.1 hypothetical protein J6U32_27020 [Gordonia polyisoprenivorans]